MDLTISQENEQFLQQEMARGVYRDRIEAVNSALDLLRQRQELRARLEESRRQLDAGEYTEYDSPGLPGLLSDLKRSAGSRAEPPNQ